MSSSSVLGMRVALLAAEVADAERYRRGRYYVRQGAVVALEVTLGVLFGSVQGSRPSPYTVEVHLQPGRGRMRGPVPGKHDIAARCSCPDDSPCCKHAVAVLVAFA